MTKQKSGQRLSVRKSISKSKKTKRMLELENENLRKELDRVWVENEKMIGLNAANEFQDRTELQTALARDELQKISVDKNKLLEEIQQLKNIKNQDDQIKNLEVGCARWKNEAIRLIKIIQIQKEKINKMEFSYNIQKLTMMSQIDDLEKNNSQLKEQNKHLVSRAFQMSEFFRKARKK